MTDADWAALEAGGPGVPDPLADLYGAGPPESRVVEDIPPGAEGVSGPYSDEPPAHARKDWAALAPDGTLPRVTQAVRRDVAAKIGIPLAITGAVYEMRDPYCGGAFQGIRKDLAAELADLACDSPQVLAFFLGRGGKYMRYLNIGFTLLPWLEMMAAHHIMHSIGEGAPAQPSGPVPAPDFARYPA